MLEKISKKEKSKKKIKTGMEVSKEKEKETKNKKLEKIKSEKVLGKLNSIFNSDKEKDSNYSNNLMSTEAKSFNILNIETKVINNSTYLNETNKKNSSNSNENIEEGISLNKSKIRKFELEAKHRT